MSNDEIKAAGSKASWKRRCGQEGDAIGHPIRSDCVLLEGERCDRALAASSFDQPPCKNSLTTPALQYPLARQKMHQVSECLRTPDHSILNDRVPPFPVLVTVPFAH